MCFTLRAKGGLPLGVLVVCRHQRILLGNEFLKSQMNHLTVRRIPAGDTWESPFCSQLGGYTVTRPGYDVASSPWKDPPCYEFIGKPSISIRAIYTIAM